MHLYSFLAVNERQLLLLPPYIALDVALTSSGPRERSQSCEVYNGMVYCKRMIMFQSYDVGAGIPQFSALQAKIERYETCHTGTRLWVWR